LILSLSLQSFSPLPPPFLFPSVFSVCYLLSLFLCVAVQSLFCVFAGLLLLFSPLFRLLRTIVVASRSPQQSVFSFPSPLLTLLAVSCDALFFLRNTARPRLFSALLLFYSLHATNFTSIPANFCLRSACAGRTERSDKVAERIFTPSVVDRQSDRGERGHTHPVPLSLPLPFPPPPPCSWFCSRLAHPVAGAPWRRREERAVSPAEGGSAHEGRRKHRGGRGRGKEPEVKGMAVAQDHCAIRASPMRVRSFVRCWLSVSCASAVFRVGLFLQPSFLTCHVASSTARTAAGVLCGGQPILLESACRCIRPRQQPTGGTGGSSSHGGNGGRRFVCVE
jgi:hypothetical protein